MDKQVDSDRFIRWGLHPRHSLPAADPIPRRFPPMVIDRLEHLVLAAADQQLHCVIRFAGRIDAARLARAVRLTLDAEPVLGCRLVSA